MLSIIKLFHISLFSTQIFTAYKWFNLVMTFRNTKFQKSIRRTKRLFWDILSHCQTLDRKFIDRICSKIWVSCIGHHMNKSSFTLPYGVKFGPPPVYIFEIFYQFEQIILNFEKGKSSGPQKWSGRSSMQVFFVFGEIQNRL